MNSENDSSDDKTIKTGKLDWESPVYLELLDQTQIVYERILSGEDFEDELRLFVGLHQKCLVDDHH